MTKAKVKALFQALEDRDLDAVRRTLDEHPDAREVRGVGKALFEDKTPLMYALQCSNAPAADLLLDRGADVHARMATSWQWPALHFAVRAAAAGVGTSENLRILERILSLGADANVKDAFGNGALDRALMDYDKVSDHVRVIELLLGAGADPDALGASKSTARQVVQNNPHAYTGAVRRLFAG
ncbi:MAG TPA: ankyrin repeat domain-containing protein [Polyangia bacterium]|nr:ankyrin repeat domain-containing protein [Polyangia bacterium]